MRPLRFETSRVLVRSLVPGAMDDVNELAVKRGQASLAYGMLLTGMMCGAFLPLAYWGSHGTVLCLWLVIVGLALLHEQIAVASLFITLGIVASINAELPMTETQKRMAQVDQSTGVMVGDILFYVAVAALAAAALVAAALWAVRPLLAETMPVRPE